jgi:AbrB family looped-hinge helix DNA binding protein
MSEQAKVAALTAKVGPKGQIVIPKEIRDMFAIAPGDTVLVLADAERGIALQPVKGNEALFEQVFGARVEAAPSE